MENNRDLNRLKVVLADKKRTNKWLAEQLVKDPATVSKWCTNTCQPDLGNLMKISQLLEVDVNELLRSALKFGREIVAKYGYLTEDGKKTYQNTAQCDPPNSQGLFLNVNQLKALLELQAQKTRVEDVAAWRLLKLHQRLTIKHHETFWIEVENAIHDNKEYFCYKQIEHTRNPNVGQFDVLLEQNLITVDLLLCRPSGNGDTYSFKIKKKGMPLLFPESISYSI